MPFLAASLRVAYHQIHDGLGEVANRVLIEAGAATGREPTANVELRSYLGQYMQEKGITLGTEDKSSSESLTSLSRGHDFEERPVVRRAVGTRVAKSATLRTRCCNSAMPRFK